MTKTHEYNRDTVLVLTGMPFATILNPFANEKKPGVYRAEVGEGIMYIASPTFSLRSDFTCYRTPRPIFLGQAGNPFICHSPHDIKVEIKTPVEKKGVVVHETTRGLERFVAYDLREDPVLENGLREESIGFFPSIETRVSLKDVTIELKEGDHPNKLLLIDSATTQVIRELFNALLYFWSVFRLKEYLYMISNDFYDWNSGVVRVELPLDASLRDIPIKSGRCGTEEIKWDGGVTLPHYIVTGAVVDRTSIERIISNYPLDDHFEKTKQ